MLVIKRIKRPLFLHHHKQPYPPEQPEPKIASSSHTSINEIRTQSPGGGPSRGEAMASTQRNTNPVIENPNVQPQAESQSPLTHTRRPRIIAANTLLHKVTAMQTHIYDTKAQMGVAAASQAAEAIRNAIARKNSANIILATGASQFDTIAALVAEPDIDWAKVTMFHLDEYIALGPDHPASFRKYLRERFVDKIPNLKAAHFIDGDAPDTRAECDRVGEIVTANPIDVACVGIGENGHLAFNDPPADFDIEKPYIIFNLDEKCIKQQLGEGWFETLDDVPKIAISMSVRQIMKSAMIICSAPDDRKARAVKDAIQGPVTNTCPASIMQQHADCRMLLDQPAASLLTK